MKHPTRRTGSALDQAEAAFRAATSAPEPKVVQTATPPRGKEMVSLRLDREVLEHFQDEGPGWQERINAALRAAAGLD
ncbi:BrnA antitoxin family protein [uncultured Devosia sp.]|uniref:BrnA antitoxin family protein n=1 Tax=uncultured Devosia sp. TaxID=211434 RepID=UPI0035CB6097